MSKLRFIGHDKRLKTGAVYDVEIIRTRTRLFSESGFWVSIEHYGTCPYDTLASFCNNWERVN